MTKKHKKPTKRKPGVTPTSEQDWGPLFAAGRDLIEWALDIASKLSREYPEDQHAIERVRAFALAWMEGRRGEVPITDLLTTLAIIFAAIEIDTGIDSIELLAPIKTFLDTPARLPAVLRLPGAARDTEPTVRIRRFPGRRNAAVNPFSIAP